LVYILLLRRGDEKRYRATDIFLDFYQKQLRNTEERLEKHLNLNML